MEANAFERTLDLAKLALEEPTANRKCFFNRQGHGLLPCLLDDLCVEGILASNGFRVFCLYIPDGQIGYVKSATKGCDQQLLRLEGGTAAVVHKQLPTTTPATTGTDCSAGFSEVLIHTEVVDTAMERTGDVLGVTTLHCICDFRNQTRQHLVPTTLKGIVELLCF